MYKCERCDREMLTNSFICGKCEYRIGREYESHHTETVRIQYLKDREQKAKNSQYEKSQYWDWSYNNRPRDDDGDIIEHTQANPDVLADTRPKTHLGSKCALCGARVIIHSDGIDPHVHPTCWSTFKGQMLKVNA